MLNNRRRKTTRSPTRSNYFITTVRRGRNEPVPEESAEEKLAKVPLDQDETFLKAVKNELLALRKRVRHETL